MSPKQFKTDWAGRELKVEIGHLAQQANGAVLLTYGQTTVLATATMSGESRPVDYLPLTVDYEERLYAAGKIKSGRFLKREGRVSDEAVLTGRMIDRVIRPNFSQKIRNDLQVVLTVLSFDKENDPDMPALLAASLALGISNIPWDGPIAGLRISRAVGDKEEWLLNPTYQGREKSDFDLVIAGKEDKINMLEGGADQLPEEKLLSAIEFSQPHLKEIIQWQKKIIQEINPTKAILATAEEPAELVKKIKEKIGDRLENALYQPGKSERLEELAVIEKELIEDLAPDSEEKTNQIKEIFEEEINRIVHQNILGTAPGQEKRPDGRKLDEVRSIKTQVGLLSRTHGSALFERGETQALSVVTLGAPGDEQTVESMRGEGKKGFFHHYNFPPYCTGETGRLGGPGRREIGHGALAERALLPLIPSREKFPYTIRLVSEILSSNGSSSMASVSGSSLALMDAGVPIKEHISGVAMGLMMASPDNYRVLTDIQGPEDHHGDMDCKIAGTAKGVTACQMDVKIEGVSLEILKKVFIQAREARLRILKEMAKTISQPREELSPLAPRILTIRINPERIRDVIGPGGKIINEITGETGVKIDIEDDGLINITSADEEAGQKALKWVENLTHEVKVGEVFQGRVTKITDFGAFLEILPGQEGLLHISEMAPYRVRRVEDIVKTGQMVPVKVKKIDEQGRIGLSMNNAKNEK
ncbi:MAG: polyribonucleotide nucleotidyltransferase [Candidatus Portnoybacteria bacterium CG03_land_8_20_14_0_80_41_10]|uniref:Polyribonucleotide nucleotidyltransferase n=1 Tax=Candidatus Portnoybacteria bacterium CG03_land_8_20_14_0_80_41_10 TaxID=1974808 RepID=A0A2M7BUX0_9BACT|nr:MAG: polyribonucleotide nucleotidyltransferase [Candidatus Portnoybacteria bacterium CG03_land_8_20_14_0_80_41_10]